MLSDALAKDRADAGIQEVPGGAVRRARQLRRCRAGDAIRQRAARGHEERSRAPTEARLRRVQHEPDTASAGAALCRRPDRRGRRCSIRPIKSNSRNAATSSGRISGRRSPSASWRWCASSKSLRALIGAAGAYGIADSLEEADERTKNPSYLHLLIGGIVLIVGYAILVPILGFLLGSLLFMAAFMYLGRYRNHFAIWTISVVGDPHHRLPVSALCLRVAAPRRAAVRSLHRSDPHRGRRCVSSGTAR